MSQLPAVDQQALNVIYYDPQTEHGFQDKPVDVELLKKAVELALLPPTAYNCSPMRIVFVPKSNTAEREKLYKCLMPNNVPQTSEADVVAIVCFDNDYQKKLPQLMPAVPNAQEIFESSADMLETAKIRNANLQAGYFILALRSLGLGVGPMSGFDNAAVDEAFLKDTTWKSNFIINIGHPVVEKRYPRMPRLSFEEATKFL